MGVVGDVGFRRKGGAFIRKSGGWIEREVVGRAVVPLKPREEYIWSERGREAGKGRGRSVSVSIGRRANQESRESRPCDRKIPYLG